jgi:NTP pyrophosphatase (non-canonical NTP hydrolase)
METDDIPKKAPSIWIPLSDPGDLAAFGKLQEELGELVSIIGRIQCQGLEGIDPDTGKSNRKALEDELADVKAMCFLVINRFNLDFTHIITRREAKIDYTRVWLDTLDKLKGNSDGNT